MGKKKAIRFKASLSFKQLIDAYVHNLQSDGMMFKNISFRGEVFISKQEIKEYFYSLGKQISIPNRIQLLKDWLLIKMDEKEKEEKGKEWVLKESELLDREDYLKVYRKLQKEQRFTENTFNDFEREENMLADWIIKRKLAPLRKKLMSWPLSMSGAFTQVYLPGQKKLSIPFSYRMNGKKSGK